MVHVIPLNFLEPRHCRTVIVLDTHEHILRVVIARIRAARFHAHKHILFFNMYARYRPIVLDSITMRTMRMKTNAHNITVVKIAETSIQINLFVRNRSGVHREYSRTLFPFHLRRPKPKKRIKMENANGRRWQQLNGLLSESKKKKRNENKIQIVANRMDNGIWLWRRSARTTLLSIHH